MSEKKERKNFSISTINEVFEEQGHSCSKCGRSLLGGFEAHHISGDRSDNTKENCQLLCAACHDAEKWETLQKQKIAVIGELTELVRKAIDGQMAGAVIDKVLTGIKMKLSLQRQVYGDRLLEAPATSRVEYSEAIAEYNLKEWMRGVKEGYLKGIDILKEKRDK